MDYTKFVNAIKEGPSSELSSLYSETFDTLCSYLRTTMRASIPDAEDCAQHALVKTVERIQDNAIREPDSIYSYLIQSAKNRYLRIRYEQNRSNYQENIEEYIPIEEQVDLLTSNEEQEALERCLDQLPSASRKFINYWMEYPDARADDVASDFDISINNVWIRKHRIIKKLSECIQLKLEN